MVVGLALSSAVLYAVASVLQQHSGRVPLLHLKDMAPGPRREMTAVGDGIMPWTEILAAA